MVWHGVFGTASIKLSIILFVQEGRNIKETPEECRAEPEERGVSMRDIKIKIKMPATVMIAEELPVYTSAALSL